VDPLSNKTEADSIPDEVLIKRAFCDNDEDAVDAFCNRYLILIKRNIAMHCKRLSIPAHKADDIVQDLFMKAVRHFRDEPTRPLSLGWFLTVAKRTALDFAKSKPATLAHCDSGCAEIADTGVGPAKAMEIKDEIRKYFSWIPEDDRDLLERVHVLGQTMAEVGEAMGISADAASKKHQRATQTIRDLIELHGEVKLPRLWSR
jgi:RNA polymerase sigma factor (sigma-70 family)